MHVYGAPLGVEGVPVVFGFRTREGGERDFGDAAMVRLRVVGLNFAAVGVDSVQDVENLPPITRINASEDEVHLFFESDPLVPDTNYQVTLLASTSGVDGTTLGTAAVAWYGYDSADASWHFVGEHVRDLSSFVNGSWSYSLANAALTTAAVSLAGSSVSSAWALAGSRVVVVDVRLLMPAADGVVSIMPFPPSLWSFGDTVAEGDACPTGSAGVVGVLGSGAVGVTLPAGVARCVMRRRGGHENSIDLWLSGANFSLGTTVSLFLLTPQAATASVWYATYQENTSSQPGYSVTALPIAAGVHSVARPRPWAAMGPTEELLGTRPTLQVSFRFGSSLIMPPSGARLELKFGEEGSSGAFTLDHRGCELLKRPLGAYVQTSSVDNACVVYVSSGGAAYWDQTYTLLALGDVAAEKSRTTFVARVFIDGSSRSWAEPFEAPRFSAGLPPSALRSATLYPTTVASMAKARIMLVLETGESTHFNGGSDEDPTMGMSLRLTIDNMAKLRLYRADGSRFVSSVPEAIGADCASWLLEVWSNAPGGFPAPLFCSWEHDKRPQPYILMRFAARAGLRALSRYEIVILAEIAESANMATDFLTVDCIGSDGAIFGRSPGVLGTTIVPQSKVGQEDDPIVRTLEVIDSDPLPAPVIAPSQEHAGGEMKIRVQSIDEAVNGILKKQTLRLFLFPLTSWNLTDFCEATRSDGSVQECFVEKIGGRMANTIRILFDPNTVPILFESDVIFTILGLGGGPPGGLFRAELGVEAWYNPRETAQYAASYISSVDRPLSSNNFISSQVGSGSGQVVLFSDPFARATNNTAALYYEPAATCRSTAEVLCRLEVIVPPGFTVLAAGAALALGGELEALLQRLAEESAGGFLDLAAEPTCDVELRRCYLDVAAGAALWQGTRYGLFVRVANPASPFGGPARAWTVQLSGSGGYNLGYRDRGLVGDLDMATSAVIVGDLNSAVAEPSSLTCGDAAYIRIHFLTTQAIPEGGTIRVWAPLGFSFRTRGPGAGLCDAVGWTGASSTSCFAVDGNATLHLASYVAASTFVAFSLRSRLPESAGSRRAAAAQHFRVATEADGVPLDEAREATWSAQRRSADGEPLFPEVMACFPHGVPRLEVSVADMRPYSALWTPTTATLRFRWGALDITESGLDVRVYAPAGYRWRARRDGTGFTASIPASEAAPLQMWADGPTTQDRDDANVLYLRSTGPFSRAKLYGISALVEVPSATPGTEGNLGSGGSWHLLFGAGASTSWAAGTAMALQPAVRSIAAFYVRVGEGQQPYADLLSASFTTATALPQGGQLQLQLPAGFLFGTFTGQACAMAEPELLGTLLPADVVFQCTTLQGVSTYKWVAGLSGLSAGSYVVGVNVVQPVASEVDLDGGGLDHLVIRSFLDVDGLVVGDAKAIAKEAAPTPPLSHAEIVVQLMPLVHMDYRYGLFNPRPQQETWVLFAFELLEDLPPRFSIALSGPVGFEFEHECGVFLGDGSNFSALDGSLTELPLEVTSYVPFPANFTASCSGDRQDAHISVSPTDPDIGVFPGMVGKLFVFRVRVTNAVRTPALNYWSIVVGSRAYGRIDGYSLWDFRETSVVPYSSAVGDVQVVTISFRSTQAILGARSPNRGLAVDVDHGTIVVRMPRGFEIVVQSETAIISGCIGFEGVTNIPDAVHYTQQQGVGCDGYSHLRNTLFIRNKMQVALEPSLYKFGVLVRNPPVAVPAEDWYLISYDLRYLDRTERALRERLRWEEALDSALAEGFATNAKMNPFDVAPHPLGIQRSWDNVTLKFGFTLSHAIEDGDVLIISLPSEYRLEDEEGPGACPGYLSEILSAPHCVGARIVWSYVGVGQIDVPRYTPIGAEAATTLSFQIESVNPPVKPARNVVEVTYCRGAHLNIHTLGALDWDATRCPLGGVIISSTVFDLWPIIPVITDVVLRTADAYPPPEFAAQGLQSSFTVSFVAVSAGAAAIKLECPGMNFGACTAVYRGISATCKGGTGSAILTLPKGQTVPAGPAAFEIYVANVANPLTAHVPTWTIATRTAEGNLVDLAQDVSGYSVLGYLAMNQSVSCKPSMLLDLAIPDADKRRQCTAQFPWYLYHGSPVRLDFEAVPGAGGLGSLTMLIQPPSGYFFTSKEVALELGSEVVSPVVGFQEGTDLAYSVVQVYEQEAAGLLKYTTTAKHLASEALLIKLSGNMTLAIALSIELRMEIPAERNVANFWRVLILDEVGKPVWTNNDAWRGPLLHGTFSGLGKLTAVQSLLSVFPSERNLIRLKLRLASPLVGKLLMIWVKAPDGFAFDSNCMAEQPDIQPAPVFSTVAGQSVTSAWVTRCYSELAAPNVAKLQIGEYGSTRVLSLDAETDYGANLILENAASSGASAVWEITTYRNGDFEYVHFALAPSFDLRTMEAYVFPEIKRYGDNSMLHVRFTPERDLGPYGKIMLNAPFGYTLYCATESYFFHGNLPDTVECSAANTAAVLSLSGGDALEREVEYTFALRVTNPSPAQYASSVVASGVDPPAWAVRLTTQDSVLVHETTEVPGYSLSSRTVARLVVTTDDTRGASGAALAGGRAQLFVRFQLETDLLPWQNNEIVLLAPAGFGFACEQDVERSGYILPNVVVGSAGLSRYEDLEPKLEVPPARGALAYTNEGTTADGRAIVNCSLKGRLALTVFFTDAENGRRYAFATSVVNAEQVSLPNLWTLQSFAGGTLAEEGSTAGYDVVPPPPNETDGAFNLKGGGLASSALRGPGFPYGSLSGVVSGGAMLRLLLAAAL